MAKDNSGIQIVNLDTAERWPSPLGDTLAMQLGYPEDATKPGIIHVRIEHGQDSPVHRHKSYTAVMVLDGALRMGGVLHRKGDVLLIEPNIWYGPLEPEPGGVEILEIHASQPGGEPIWEDLSHPAVKAVNAYLDELGTAAWKE